jgi:Ca2+-binding RTX toxin-like protein
VNRIGEFTTINGGEGNDTIEVDGFDNIVNGDAGSDTLFFAQGSTGTHRNTVNGGDGDDVIGNFSIVHNTDNTLNGGAGNDVLAVTGTGNEVNGDAGDDFLNVGGRDFDGIPSSDNILHGGAGNDVLRSFRSDGNTMTGGEGNDRFVLFETGPNTVITDFEHSTRSQPALQAEDVLDLREVFVGLNVDKPLNALVGQGYLVVNSDANVAGGAALDTVVQVDADGRAGASAPQTIVTLFDTTLTTHGADMNNWLV